MGGALAATLVARRHLPIASLSLVACSNVDGGFTSDFFARYIAADTPVEMTAVLASAVGSDFAVPPIMARSALAEVQSPGARGTLRRIATAARNVPPLSMDAIRRFDGPIGVVWGREDPITPAINAAAFADLAEVVMLDRVGHLPHIEAPKAVFDLVNLTMERS